MKQGLLLTVLLSVICSCKKKEDPSDKYPPNAHYFSFRQFARDQFESYGEQPFVLVHRTVAAGKTDSSYASADTLDWARVLKPFFDADISDHKFLGHYRYSEMDEELTQSHVLIYEAMEPKLFTQKVMIYADPLTARVTAIFMETIEAKGGWDIRKKLYYSSLQLLQIIEDRTGNGKSQTSLTEYIFPGNNNEMPEEPEQ